MMRDCTRWPRAVFQAMYAGSTNPLQLLANSDLVDPGGTFQLGAGLLVSLLFSHPGLPGPEITPEGNGADP